MELSINYFIIGKKMENHKNELKQVLENSKIFIENSEGLKEKLLTFLVRDMETVLTQMEFIPKWVTKKFEELSIKFFTTGV